MAGNGERLKGSQLGYRGKGVPDAVTIMKLQRRYSAAVEAGGLPAETRAKLIRMRALSAEAQRGERDKIDLNEMVRLRKEAAALAVELAPILHFKVDDVDWDK